MSCMSILWSCGHNLLHSGSYGLIYVFNVKFHVLMQTDNNYIITVTIYVL